MGRISSFLKLLSACFVSHRLGYVRSACAVALTLCLAHLISPCCPLYAQDNQTVFAEDDPKVQAAKQLQVQQAVKPINVAPAAPGLDFQAPSIEFKKEQNEIVGKGGILLSEGGVQVQADEAVFNTESKTGDVKGNVLITTSSGVLGAESAKLNVQSETGDFNGLEFDVEEGGYKVEAEQARKVSEFEFELVDSDMTTCRCPDGDKPWEVSSSRCNLTQEGYAHAYGSTVYFQGLPVLYAPYLVFPVKNERASGLLPARFGMGNRDGFQYAQPVFLSLDDTTGFTVTPFIATRSRVGSEFAFEKVFSQTSRMDAGFTYSNESLRDGELRGLNIKDVAEPWIDDNRFGGYWKQRWVSDAKDPYPVEFLVDGRYTSDNLYLRELPAPEIGEQQAQFLTSTAVVRGTAFEFLNLEGRSEYNQMLLEPQETVFQRVPELLASTSKTLRPFGSNPLNLKLVTGGDVSATSFIREDGYQGWRTNLHPKVALPFQFSNYVRAQVGAELYETGYSLSDEQLPPSRESFYPDPVPTARINDKPDPENPAATDERKKGEFDTNRTLPIFTYGMGSAMERVYDLDRGNLLSRIVNLGAENEGSELTRLKHTIEPTVQYRYVPDVDQTENPQFDSLDRFAHRSLLSYGFTTRLYGRFHEAYERTREVEDLTRTESTLPMFDLGQSMLDFGRGAILAPLAPVDTREGEIRELAQFFVGQGYDFVEAQRSVKPEESTNPFTDIKTGFVFTPSKYTAASFDSNVSPADGQFTSYNWGLGFRDDRGDALRVRYSFVNNTLSQAEGNLEFKITDRIRLGTYGRYSFRDSEFQESRGLLRFFNSCKCWSIDIGAGRRINPDREQFLVSITFGGVGAVTQGMNYN
ncbi:MAG: LPS-assembly protein LptD [Pseudomonadota bacterium]|jgi:LPS-assembly protein